MAVKFCYICQETPQSMAHYGQEALAEGEYCPICYQPTCRRHLSVVRWRWRESEELDSGWYAKIVCAPMLTVVGMFFHRDWIT